MELAPLIHDLAVILAVASLVSFLFHWLRVPVILGYIFAGIAVGPGVTFFPTVTDMPNIRIWGDLGVIFLMFNLGLDFSFRRLAAVGMRAAFTGIFEVTCMIALGFGMGQLLGWSVSTSLILGTTMSISSTTIILKSLENLGLMRRRFRDHVFGILIVEDLIAVLLLVAVSNIIMHGSVSGLDLLFVLGELLLVVALWMLVGFLAVPRLFRLAARFGSDELLTILALGLCFVLVAVGAHFGYSAALGAFIMGSIIGETKQARRVEELVRPMRDVFVAIFFVSIGMRVEPGLLAGEWSSILFITAAVILGKIVFVGLGSLLVGQRLRHAVQTSFTMGQIGEFSFLIAGLALTHHFTDAGFYTAIVAVSLLTTFTTPLFIRLSQPAFVWLETALPKTLLQRIDRYALLVQSAHGFSERDVTRGAVLLRWFANGILVTGVFLLSADYVLPIVRDRIAEPMLAQSAAWLLSCLGAAPFLWGMVTAYRHARSPGALFLSRLLALIWVGLLSSRFLSAWTSVAITLASVTIFVLVVYPQLESSYGWLERQFLASFAGHDVAKAQLRDLQRLAPWNEHLTQLKTSADSEIVGHSLVESRLRERFGLNVVAIQRGSRVMVAPARDERIFPDDELLVLASEDAIEKARSAVEGRAPATAGSDLTEFDLKLISISDESQLAHRSILQSQLRERFGVLVVGIEREGRRIMNPQSQLVLKPGDLIWVVGDRLRLQEL